MCLSSSGDCLLGVAKVDMSIWDDTRGPKDILETTSNIQHILKGQHACLIMVKAPGCNYMSFVGFRNFVVN